MIILAYIKSYERAQSLFVLAVLHHTVLILVVHLVVQTPFYMERLV